MNLHKMKLKYKLYLLILAVSITISFFMIGSFGYILAQYNKLLYHQTANSLTFYQMNWTIKFGKLKMNLQVLPFMIMKLRALYLTQKELIKKTGG